MGVTANNSMVRVRRSTARVNCSRKEFGEATNKSPKGRLPYLESKEEEDT
jgi:hypothetical protein